MTEHKETKVKVRELIGEVTPTDLEYLESVWGLDPDFSFQGIVGEVYLGEEHMSTELLLIINFKGLLYGLETWRSSEDNETFRLDQEVTLVPVKEIMVKSWEEL